MESYTIILTHEEYKSLVLALRDKPAYIALLERKIDHDVTIPGKWVIELSKPEACCILYELPSGNSSKRLKELFSNQDLNFYSYYDALKRDLLRFF